MFMSIYPRFCSKIRLQMFLLVSVRHLGAHLDELQHGVSIQSSINLGKTFPRISRIRIVPSTQILARVFVIYLLSLPRFWTLSVEWFWFLFWSILNGVTLKTSNKIEILQQQTGPFSYIGVALSNRVNMDTEGAQKESHQRGFRRRRVELGR